MDIPGVLYLMEEAALTLAGYINAEVCGYISVGRDAMRTGIARVDVSVSLSLETRDTG